MYMQGHSINIPGLDKVPKFPLLLLCMSTCVYKYLYNVRVCEQIDNRAYGETGTILTITLLLKYLLYGSYISISTF